MQSFVKVVAAAFAVLVCAGFDVPPRVDYEMRPVFENGALVAIQFDLRFRGDADGQTELRLPDAWGGQQELWRGVEALAVVSGATMREGAGPESRVLNHAPRARIHVRYRVIQDWDGEPAAGGNPYRPVIRPGYFHLIGNAVIVEPQVGPESPVRFRMRDLPRGWTFASDLEHRNLILGILRDSISVGGDFRILHGADRNIRVAIRGAWSFTDAAFVEEVTSIIRGQRAYWGDPSSPYLVTVIPLTAPNPGSLSVGGTGLSDAFGFFATPNAQAGRITRTLAHEGTHTWIPHRIGGMPTQGEAYDYWLSEGFTDFLAFRLLVRDGVWTPQQWAEDFNFMLRAYAQSSARTAPNARIGTDFWSDYAMQQLPYQRGRFLATWWDARLRAQGRDMDDVLLAMRDRAAARDPLRAVQMFPGVIAGFGVDVSADLTTYVESGAAIFLPEDLLAPCGRIVTRQAYRFHRGFDIEATSANNNVISGVDPNLPAYAAGMRNGQVLVRRDGGDIGNAEVEIAYVVRDGETERTIRYMPRSREMFTLQEVVLASPLEGAQLAACRAVLGGG